MPGSGRAPGAGSGRSSRRYARPVTVEVRISPARCIASKCCMNTAPAVFELDETRVSSVVDPSAAPDETIIEAAEACPTGAISVWRDGVQVV